MNLNSIIAEFCTTNFEYMTTLSVNINKIATIRNARGGNTPNVIVAAQNIERFGAEGITVHPRPDERHIRYADVRALRKVVTTEFNVEGYPTPEFMELVIQSKPHQVTLVPDAPDAITSNAGWDVETHFDFLSGIVKELKAEGMRVSIFMEANPGLMKRAAETGTDRVELYTESYAVGYNIDKEKAVAPFIEAAKAAHEAGLGVNAGHDLSLENLRYFAQKVPYLDEVSIGHALISDSLYFGLENTVQMYKNELR
ncbi:MAG: hypothetical protein RL664_53 [Bacteroidota bacterium]